MKTKICTKCNKRKNINKFYKRITGIIFSECKDCKKEYNKIHDKHKCLDCDKLIWNGFERCRHCARVYQYKINPETNTFFGKKGDQSPVFKGGWKSFCIDCGKKIDFNAIRCSHHAKIYLFKTNVEYVKSLIKSLHARPNKPEKILSKLLNKLSKDYKYVGSGSFIIGGFNPDFINCNGQKKIIELYGDYWHNTPKAIERNKLRIKTYRSYGYQTLIIWEHELENLDKVVNKIIKFI